MKEDFINAYEDSNAFPAKHALIADVFANGQPLLLLYQHLRHSIAFYTGITREGEVSAKLKGAQGMFVFSETSGQSIGLYYQDCLYLIRNLQESYRLKLPGIELSLEEKSAFQAATENDTFKLLKELNQAGKALTDYSKTYLLCSDQTERAFLKHNHRLIKDTIISHAIIQNIIYLGTESGMLYELDHKGHSVFKKKVMPFVPQFITGFKHPCVIGRNGEVHQKNNQFTLEGRVVGCVARGGKFAIAFDRKRFDVYDESFQLQYMTYTPAYITHICQLETSNVSGLIICMKGNLLAVYINGNLAIKISLKDQLATLCFGSYGRQEGCLVLVYRQKGFEIKILSRKFLKSKEKQEDQKLSFPSVTSESKSITQLQQQNGINMYYQYQVDFIQLKTNLIKKKHAIQDTQHSSQSPLKISCTLFGANPFLLRVTVLNIGSKPLKRLILGLSYNQREARVKEPLETISVILGHMEMIKEFEVSREVDDRVAVRLYLADMEGHQHCTSILSLPSSLE